MKRFEIYQISLSSVPIYLEGFQEKMYLGNKTKEINNLVPFNYLKLISNLSY